MTPALLGKKIGMTRVYDEKGSIVPVTVVQAGPCAVTQVKTPETDGYHAVQLGFGEIKAKFSTFPLIAHVAKAGHAPRRPGGIERTPESRRVAAGAGAHRRRTAHRRHRAARAAYGAAAARLGA